MRLSLVAAVLVGLCACPRAVRQERREVPVEQHGDNLFHAEAARQWDFGDGAPRVAGDVVHHRFTALGPQVVTAWDGERLAQRIELMVVPRAPLRFVSAWAEVALVAPGVDELGPMLDFAERVVGPRDTAQGLDRLPAVGFALDQGKGGSSVLAPRAAVGAFSLAGFEGLVSFVVVRDEARALEALGDYLRGQEWLENPGRSPRAWGRGPAALVAFLDRGALYVAVGDNGSVPAAVLDAVVSGGELGLGGVEGLSEALAALRPDGPWVYAHPSDRPSAWTWALGRLHVGPDEVALDGRVAAAGPLWKAPGGPGVGLLRAVPEGAFAVVAADVEPERLAAMALGEPGGPRRVRARARLTRAGVDLEALLASVTGHLAAIAWLDAEAFYRGLLLGGGRPEPRLSAQVEAGLRSAEAMARLLAVLFEGDAGPAFGPGPLPQRHTTHALGQAMEVVLGASSVRVEVGDPPRARKLADAGALLRERFPGAFGAGHVSAFLDLEQARLELKAPVSVPGVDPRKLLMAQALAITFVDQLTRLDSVFLDVAPDSGGAALRAVVRARAAGGRGAEPGR